MSEAQERDEDLEMTSVELDDDSDSNYEVVEDDDESRTNVRADSDGSDESSDESSDEDDLRQYSKNVQNRIRKLTAARRQAEEEAQAAIQYIQQVQAQNEQYKQRLSTLDRGYMSEYENRISSQEAQAKRALAEAYEAGDYDRIAEVQSAISQIAIEKERLRLQKQRAQQAQAQAQSQAQRQVPQQQAPQRQAPQRDEKLENWLERNKWFNQDKVMTSAARAIHETLVAEEGYDPRTDEYYQEIDRRMRREMPHKFQGERKNVQSVTPAGGNGRSLKSGRKKSVELTQGQMAFAKKLGIPLEKYAAEVAKIANRRD